MKRLPFILIAMFFAVSCKMKEQGTAEAKSDTDIEAVTDTDFCFKMDGTLPATPLFNNLTDAYNGFLVLNSLLCDYDTWDRGLAPNAKQSVGKIDCSMIKCDSIRWAAQHYKDFILSVVSNDALRGNTATFSRVDSAYGRFKRLLVERYHVSNYGDLPEEKYWEIYDKSNVVADYDSIYYLDKTDSLTAINLKGLAEKETDFDKKCVYALEYAHAEDVDLKVLEKIMLSRQYSVYLFETWRYWRCLLQDRHGASLDSDIPNNVYNRMRMICAATILKHIVEHPNDIMAINQFLILSAHDDIYRYGSFQYGNQNMTEKWNLFPERYE